MKKTDLADAMIGMVPQWYRTEEGASRGSIRIDGDDFFFSSRTHFTPELKALMDYIQENLERWRFLISGASLLGTVESLQERIAMHWLEHRYGEIHWGPLLNYLRRVAQRTYENEPVTLNLVISDGVGREDVTAKGHQKLLDPLSISPNVFFRIDSRLRFIDYEEVDWFPDPENRVTLCPLFLLPLVSRLGEHEVSIHQTSRGDLLVMNSLGLLASRRKGSWTIYDPQALVRSVSWTLEDFCKGASVIGPSLLNLAVDLSYKRHGGLLLFDPLHVVLDDHLLNKEARLSDEAGALNIYSLVGGAVRAIELEAGGFSQRVRRRTAELASMDGAFIFDKDSILSFGAMIESDFSSGHPGARTTAAYSAREWGALPIKISADGEITILFSENASDPDGENRVYRELSFL